MAEAPPPELIQKTIDAIKAIADIPSANEKNLSRPPAKVIQEIFTGVSKATGFPDPAIIQEKEIPKEMKQERIDYIQSIIKVTSEALKQEIPCEAKNITGGKEVAATLLFLIKLCEAARLKKAAQQAPPEEKKPKTPVKIPEPEPPKPVPQETPKIPVSGLDDLDVKPAPFTFGEEVPPPKQVFVEEAPKQVFREDPKVDERRQAMLQQQKEEEELRQYEEIRKKQEAAELDQQLKTQQAMQQLAKPSDKAQTFQPKKKVQQSTDQQPTQYQVKIIRDEESDDAAKQENPANINVVEQLGFENDKTLAGLFEAPVVGAQNGAFMQDIQQTSEAYQVPLTADQKRIQAQQKVSNQANSKLVLAVQDAVRQVIPFSKATSFLEEHLVRMRQELMQAIDDCQAQEQARQRAINLENKNKSVLDAKLRSVQEQVQGVKAALGELAQQVVV